jgi:CHAT domain-containing protein
MWPTRLTILASLLLLVFAGVGWANTSPEAEERSNRIFEQIKQYEQAGDMAAAASAAADASTMFAAEGEHYLAASYWLMKAEFIAATGDWQQIERDLNPRLDELLRDLDNEDKSRGDTLLMVMMDTQGFLGRRNLQDKFAARWLERIVTRFGKMSPEDIQARLRAAQSLLQTGADQEGYRRLKDALAASATSPHHALTITAYLTYARAYMQANQLDRAVELFEAGLASQAARVDTADLPNLITFYASIKADSGRLDEAVKDFERAAGIAERMFGKASEGYVLVRDEHATALARNGYPASSTTMMGQNYQLALKTFGPDFNWTWKTANNYADQLRQIGAPEEAIKLDSFLLEKRAAHYGTNHLNVYVSANNMAQNQLALGRYDEARKYLEQQRSIGEVLDRTQPGYDYVAQAEAWLTLCDAMSGKLPSSPETLATLEAIVPSQAYAGLLRIYAASFAAARREAGGDREGGLKLRRVALDISMSFNRATHPQTFDLRLDIARARSSLDRANAIRDFEALDADMRSWMAREVGSAGDRVVAEATRALGDNLIDAFGKLAMRDKAAVPGFARAALGWKSLNQDERQRYIRIARSAVDRKDRQTEALARQALRLSDVLNEMRASGGSTEWSEAIASQAVSAEEALKRRLGELPDFVPVALPSALDALGQNDALINYVVTRNWRPDRRAADPFKEVTLYAVVMRRDRVNLFELGDPRKLQSIDAEYQIARLRSTRSAAERGAIAIADTDIAFDNLYDRLVKPLSSSLDGVKTLYIVPDAQLYSLPFALLRDGEGRLLEDRFTLRFLTRPDALYDITGGQKMATGANILLAGGLDYVNGDERGAEPLPGTRREVDDIGNLLKGKGAGVTTMTGAAATEDAVRERAQQAVIVHLATHGAYENERSGSGADVDSLWRSSIILSRSGNRRSMSRDAGDGRLYAYELMDWDLTRLELLVLSACETGRGDESFVSGLRGLPTAIAIAGARRSLLTLWPVDDAGTEQFMVRLYQRLADGETYPEALRQTRRDAIAGKLPAAADPRVWAAFVMFEN